MASLLEKRATYVLESIFRRNPKTQEEVAKLFDTAVKECRAEFPEEGGEAAITQQLARTLFSAKDHMKERFVTLTWELVAARNAGHSLMKSPALNEIAKKRPDVVEGIVRHFDGRDSTQNGWPKSGTFDLGHQVRGTLQQVYETQNVELRRAGSGGGNNSKDSKAPPNSFKKHHYELFRRLVRGGIGVESSFFDGEQAGASADLQLALTQDATDRQIIEFVDELFRQIPKKKKAISGRGGSPHSPFRVNLTTNDFDVVIQAISNSAPPIDLVESRLVHWFQSSANIVLEGVPGTGKTHALTDLSGEVLTATNRIVEILADGMFFMTMHPSTSYEDFVEGLRPASFQSEPLEWSQPDLLGISLPVQQDQSGKRSKPTESILVSVSQEENANKFSVNFPGSGWFVPHLAPSSKSAFALVDGFFIRACRAAVTRPNTAIIVVLDELNRCNIPKVLGDLMTVIEESKRAHWDGTSWVVDSAAKAVTLPYSGRKLFVPDNLFIVGTMNTTDRSVAPMDAALRRRFSFHRIWPDGFSASAPKPKLTDVASKLQESAIKPHTELWLALNQHLLAKFGADAMLGHSYLYDLRTALARDAESAPYHWNHRILPQLMDVIASNGLTRSLVEDPKAFFGTSDKILDRIEVAVAGSGSLRTAELRYRAS